MKTRQLIVLFLPASELGHISASIGIACALKRRGHRVVFATEKSWIGKFAEYGFDEEVYYERDDKGENLGKFWAEFIARASEYMPKPPIEQIEFVSQVYEKVFETLQYSYKDIKRIVEKVKPDIIIFDHVMTNPGLITSNIPIIYSFSANPLMAFDDESLPAWFLGLPLDDKSEWENQRKRHVKSLRHLWIQYSEWMKSVGAPELRENKLQYRSANLNLYIYPDALVEDYLKLCPIDHTWMGLSHAIRDKLNSEFQIPEKLRSLPGKLIYFSLGFTGSSVVELMKRMMSILSKSKHRFIIVKGQFLNDYELPPNMWGETFVPQVEILPFVDLVITHGGNNSLLETLYFGKPLIVLPVLADQHDNAQRVVEKKTGLKFNPFSVGEDELLKAIDNVLSDTEMYAKVKKISEEMRQSKSMERLVERIESIAENPIMPPLIEQKSQRD